ncbi:hypothetical protein Amsp01_091170 [Amycolatopsis sp. NBRC 101858]|uniref:hypothetical protein n=1 Tax=Amycolatopsis sp. NBRC 101858 TaxID=3032200 RepID=UPI0024A10DCD|nr:hypothetical protein [Amycolatopsis sp. NBRC 101858]GLY43094.1 hypothetical protein Amsp01_091170 [Amycolatopsis sp. NBRC 101858]
MFFPLAKALGNQNAELGAQRVFRLHPNQIAALLDEIWGSARRTPQIPDPSGEKDLVFFARFFDDTVLDALDLPTQPGDDPFLSTDGLDAFLAPSGVSTAGSFEWSGRPNELFCPPLLWHHLAYAYVLESTGIVEIFAEVVRRLVVGETMGVLSPDSIAWLRATEQLFFRDLPTFSVASVLSQVRPFDRTNRRNAYWRMFGLDLAHAVPPLWAGSGPLADWKDLTGPVNHDFRQKWSELLRQIWIGVENRANNSGANPTDPSYIALLSRALKDLLGNRRRGGALAREEFAYVTMLNWFHLTVDSDTSLIVDLQAQASSAADRLGALGQKVGITPALRSRELFDLAEPMSTLLRGIELGLFDTESTAATLFTGGTNIFRDVLDTINNWQSATGERVKESPARQVTTATGGQPLRVPVPAASPAAMAPLNGSAPALSPKG